jgi:hypothetical protein
MIWDRFKICKTELEAINIVREIQINGYYPEESQMRICKTGPMPELIIREVIGFFEFGRKK